MTETQQESDYSNFIDQNLEIGVEKLIVDVNNEKSFNIYDYFGIKVPSSLIEDWDTDNQIPFTCEVECTVSSNDYPITCPVTLLSDQYKRIQTLLPNISPLHNINREKYIFIWKDRITVPICYSDLPIDSVINFSFFVRLFQSKPKLIGTAKLNLFTKKKKNLRYGPFTLTFDGTEKQSRLQKHVRKLGKYEDYKTYKFIDAQIFFVTNELHPRDAEKYFDSLLNPLQPLKLSDSAQFAKIFICTPNLKSPKYLEIHSKDPIWPKDINKSINPCQNLYNALIKEENINEKLNRIKSYSYGSSIDLYDRIIIYNNYKRCLSDPDLISAVFRAVDLETSSITNDIVEIIKRETLDLEHAIELLSPMYNNKIIKDFAIRSLKAVPKEDLILYHPQIIQACKAEHTEELLNFLIEGSRNDPIFASSLYWNANIEKETDKTMEKIITKLISSINEDVKKDLNDQISFIERLTELLTEGSKDVSDKNEKRKKIIDLLQNHPVYKELQHFPPVRLPMSLNTKVVGIDPEDVRVFQSKLCPVCITFKKEDGELYRFVFKMGDDMRQDKLIIQLFEVMDNIFKNASMQLYVTPYKTFVFSPTYGCCEFIENSQAILDIMNDEKVQTISNFLADSDGEVNGDKIERFTKSLAAYSVMTYILLVGDRHDNNILVAKDGRIVHIDFGFVFGDSPKPFIPPLKISREMVETVDPEDGLDKICSWACPAFNSIRKKSRFILVLIELMFTAHIECFDSGKYQRLEMVEERLLLNCTEIEAMNSLREAFSTSLNSKMQVLWDALHAVSMAGAQ